MSWLTNFVRPKIRALVRKTDVPENLWDKCGGCGQMIFHRDLEANLKVCPQSGENSPAANAPAPATPVRRSSPRLRCCAARSGVPS